MRTSLMAVITVLIPIVGFAGEQPIPTDVTTVTGPTLQKFQGEDYRLAWVSAGGPDTQGEVINEYIRPNETLENWTRLIAVRFYPQRRDYQHMAGNLVKALRQQNPLARFAIFESPDRTRTMVDFVTWDLNAKITEFNVFIYQLDAKGESVVAQQFAMRAYGDDEGREFLLKLKDLRPQLLEEVAKFEFPAVTTRQP